MPNDIMSVLGLNSGYMVEYTPLPSGVPSGTPSGGGVYFSVYPSSRPNMNTLYHDQAIYREITFVSYVAENTEKC